MSTGTDAILAYGYDLGDDFGLSAGAEPAWYDEDDSDPANGLVQQALNELLASAATSAAAADGVSFSDADWDRVDSHGVDWDDLAYGTDEQIMAALGVVIVEHCSDRAPMFLLAAKVAVASRGYPEVVDFAVPDGADERLAACRLKAAEPSEEVGGG